MGSSPLTSELKPVVFVIDDDPSVRKSLERLLRSLEFDVETFDSAARFLEHGRCERVGCIVLDIRMPGLSGMDLQEELNKADYRMPIIFITGHGDIATGVQAMKKGAADFLTKPFDDAEFLQAVRRAIEEDKKAKMHYAGVRDILGRIQRLTPREHEILRYIISGTLNKQTASKLGIAEKTVKVHRGRIMNKLNAGSVVELTRLAQEAGIEPLHLKEPPGK